MDSLPSPQQSFGGSFNPGTVAPEFVMEPVSGEHVWYLAVPNNGNTTVTSYTITADDVAGPPVPTSPTITGVTIIPNFGLTIFWNSIPGKTYEVDTSTDLITWTPIITFVATSTTSSFTDFSTSAPQQYFRILQLP